VLPDISFFRTDVSAVGVTPHRGHVGKRPDLRTCSLQRLTSAYESDSKRGGLGNKLKTSILTVG
jgi:hypothetical protein